MTKLNELSRKELAKQQIKISEQGILQCKQQIESYGRFVWEHGKLLDLQGSIERFTDMQNIYKQILDEETK